MQDLKKESFTGAKSGSGVAEFIINHVPACFRFHEAFGGTGIISKTLDEALAFIVEFYYYEINPETFDNHLKKRIAGETTIWPQLGDSIQLINEEINRGQIGESDCFYFDPPYRMESRTHQRKYYKKYDWDEGDHNRFFKLVDRLNKIGADILISHYPDPVYDEQFKSWNSEDFQTRTRRSTVTERLYWNFNLEERRLATTDFLGKNYTDRQRIKRKVERMTAKIAALPRHERQAIIESLLIDYEC